ncbi:binding-protein-dependent transport systems inner membrane component [Paenibacillus vortex V453]|uniref:Binding-protein-dependent transport systems inner membrane component n=1 Tax=Paenibacillus vortex V453 TaxID=715225 RepID=A0A2R9SNV1_9BACL|nr:MULTISPECIES: carbohydrate ABC transporter permease [Paenibacillus]ANA79047.1 ABC transporter permease [Paenibacillus glucanolyticus]AVV57037.1 carbohydrate ABC transporter permease [Paenibacillus glucanolyticus]AWP26179.1 ABC transporter permease [Paenibacillus sp. Cedars]EFU39011.1 binding-protein-dependent transport systems inner membrane component [Paenibacillus vortex V453]ETT39430.1 binding-protein-dependent transport systems inner membrane component [Paenibacillus sp. FSL R5-808]
MVRLAFGDKVMMVIIYIFLALLAFVTFYPFWNGLVISFNSGSDTAMGGVTFWPRDFTLENYGIVFQDTRLLNGFKISVLRTVIGTISSILVTSIFAYGMTKSELIGRKYYMIMCIITMYFGGGLIPTFMLVRGLGLMDSFWVFIIPGLVSVWNMIIFRTFFNGLPNGLEESAKIDGCGNWGIFFKIILPLSGPVIATLSLFTAVSHWNEWFLPSIYINNENLLPIQTMLRQILNSNIMSEQMSNLDSASQAVLSRMQSVTSKSLSMATMMVATLPIIMVYPFVQKHFVKGVLVGSLKE